MSATSSSVHTDQDSQQIIEDKQDQLLYRKFVFKEPIEVTRFCAIPKARHAIYANPAIFSQLSGIGVHQFANQFLKLWPEARETALPYLSIPAAVAGVVGFTIGVHSLSHLKDEYTHPFKNIWLATLEGFLVFSFLMGEEIYIYCGNAKNCTVTEAVFWETFFPPPMTLATTYVAWKAIPLLKKMEWSSQGKIKKYLLVTLDSVMDILYYSRIFETLMSYIAQIPKPLLYEFGAIPAAVLVLGTQIIKPHHSNTFRTIVTAGTTFNLWFYLTKFLIWEFSSSPEYDPYSWSAIFKAALFPLLLVTGTVFTIYRSRHSVIEHRATEQWVPVGKAQWLLDQHVHESLEQRPEFRKIVFEKISTDAQMKHALLQDDRIKNALLADLSIREQLFKIFKEDQEMRQVEPSISEAVSGPGDPTESFNNLSDDESSPEIDPTEMLPVSLDIDPTADMLQASLTVRHTNEPLLYAYRAQNEHKLPLVPHQDNAPVPVSQKLLCGIL